MGQVQTNLLLELPEWRGNLQSIHLPLLLASVFTVDKMQTKVKSHRSY
jgi:hypothetical protein